MIFESIYIQNFLSIKKITLNLRDMGLVLLNGRNLDNPSLNNNGAGKSSILEAIIYALYGKTIRGLKGDAVVNKTTGKNTKVFLDISDDDGSKYRIARYRKHTTNKSKIFLYKNSVDITPKSEADFEKYVTELLQADYTTFTSSLLYSAESFKFTTATDSEIKKIFDTMLGLETLTKCKDVVHQHLSTIQMKLDKAKSIKVSKEHDVKEIQDQINTQQCAQNNWKAEQDKRITHVVESQQSLKEKIHNLQNELSTSQGELNELTGDIEDLKEMIESKNTLLNQVDDIKQDSAEIAAHIKDVEWDITLCKNNIKHSNDSILKHVDESKALDTKIQQLQSKIHDLQSQVGQPCPVCGKPLDHTSVDKASQEYQDQIQQFQQQLQDIDEDKSDKSAQIAKFQQQITEHTRLLESLNQEKQTLEDTLHKFGAVEESRDKLEKRLTRACNYETQLKLDIASKESILKETCAQISMLDKNLDELKSATNPYNSIVETLQSNCKAKQAEVDECSQIIPQLQDKRECLEFWNVAYSNQGIKSFILDDIVPFLNRRVNKYLSKLTSNQIEVIFSTQSTLKNGESREKFSIETINKDGGDQYIANSGGERKRIDLAINLALQDLVASRSSKKINIAIFDEVFDSLDENGIDGVISLLQELAQTKSTILVVSHNEYLKSYFTNVLNVVKQHGYSTLQKEVIEDV